MSEKRTDRVELHGGIVHLPAEFREVARLANQAGLEGWKFVDAEYGLDIAAARKVLLEAADGVRVPDLSDIGSQVKISYEAHDVADLRFLKWLEKAAPETMRTWRENWHRSVETTSTTGKEDSTVSKEKS